MLSAANLPWYQGIRGKKNYHDLTSECKDMLAKRLVLVSGVPTQHDHGCQRAYWRLPIQPTAPETSPSTRLRSLLHPGSLRHDAMLYMVAVQAIGFTRAHSHSLQHITSCPKQLCYCTTQPGQPTADHADKTTHDCGWAVVLWS